VHYFRPEPPGSPPREAMKPFGAGGNLIEGSGKLRTLNSDASQRIAPKASTFCIARPHGPFRSRQLAPKRPDNSTRLSQNSQRHYPDEVFGIRDKPIAPASPWQNAFAERLIGSIRRECVDHIIVCVEF
jgi:transposase InsO family protein